MNKKEQLKKAFEDIKYAIDLSDVEIIGLKIIGCFIALLIILAFIGIACS